MSVLEIARQCYEDVEACERAIGEQLNKKPRTAKQQVEQQHAISNLLDHIQTQSATVSSSVLVDADGAFAEELQGMRGVNAFGAFYAHLKDTKDYRAKYPNARDATSGDANSASLAAPKVEFSGEEVHGKCLDLVSFHDRATNLRACFAPKDYAAYVADFSGALAGVPFPAKSGAYAAYVADLQAYLADFFHRTQPLVDVPQLLARECDAPFRADWANGRGPPGWEQQAAAAAAAASGSVGGRGGEGSSGPAGSGGSGAKPVDLKNLHSAEAVAALGPARLAEGLAALGLKTGGGLSERAQRLFATKDLPREQWPKKAFAAKASGGNKGGGSSAGSAAVAKKQKQSEAAYALALAEARVAWLAAQLEEAVEATLKHVERKHAMRLEERKAEMEEEEADGGDNGDEDEDNDEEEDEEGDGDAPLYNPLNLPLGWDGKPIPYWLYKLHGLGVEFKCEVCGNASYFGRRAFDKHFQEWRHAYGMRCLGLPNTKHFHDITLIEDAIALNAKLQEGIEVESFDPAVAEEYEDSEGHVLNRKTYEDLARQGLL